MADTPAQKSAALKRQADELDLVRAKDILAFTESPEYRKVHDRIVALLDPANADVGIDDALRSVNVTMSRLPESCREEQRKLDLRLAASAPA